MTPSSYQLKIYEEISSGSGHLLIEAVAGSGKTTTIIEALKLLPPDKKVLFLAFNREIIKTLKARSPEGTEVSTFHSLGYAICIDSLKWFKTNERKILNLLQYRFLDWDNATEEVKRSFWENQKDIRRLISLLKAEACQNTQEVLDKLPFLYEHFGIDLLSKDWEALLVRTYLESNRFIKGQQVLDYDDMLLFPLLYEMGFPKYDFIFVDEAQDLNYVQRLFIEKMMLPTTRLIAVGDSKQAIYGFRGARASSMRELRDHFHMKTLPLSICYRCSKQIVEEAKKLVPQIEPAPTANEGLVRELQIHLLPEEVHVGDMILCRCVAPLISLALTLSAKRIPVNVLGEDIGKNILDFATLVEKFRKNTLRTSIISVSQYLETKLMQEKKTKAAFTQKELCNCLLSLCNNQDLTLGEISLRVKNLFSPSMSAVVFLSTIHKAKGKEWPSVFLLRPDLLPHPLSTQDWEIEQEMNLKYVAITRAISQLVYLI